MAYLSLYRKFRPSSFDTLLGQDHVVRILKNQIKTATIGHAYLFTGARGTGKTSAAKIFARAVNCLHPEDGSPCGKCSVCKALSDSNNLDVLEIDAASNNGVDEIRDLKEKIQYPPVSARYKVYIVDEVHMLSLPAFNALLKTLEEPPAHAIFILATTEVQKLPDTILSRCMRFDFRLLPEEIIADHLREIFKEVGKQADDGAIAMIASSGYGSMRDALSVADMCLSYSTDTLTYSDVLAVLGATDRGIIVDLVGQMLKGDHRSCLDTVDKVIKSGVSVSVFAKDLSAILRDILILKSNSDAKFQYPEDIFKRMTGIAKDYSVSVLLRALEYIAGLEAELRYSVQPRLILEATVLRIGEAKSDLNVDGLLTRIQMLEDRLKRIEEGGVTVVQSSAVTAQKKEEIIPDPMGGDSRRIWARLVKYLRDKNMFALYTGALSAKETAIDGDSFIVTVDGDSSNYSILATKQNVEEISRLLTLLTGIEYKFVCKLPDGVDEPKSGDIERIKSLVGDDKLKIIR